MKTLVGVTSYQIHENKKLQELTKQCLNSVVQQKCTYPFKTILVDDSSILENISIPESVTVRRVNHNNLSKSWNIICREAFYKECCNHALILNNDVELLPNSLQSLLDFATVNPSSGLIYGLEIQGNSLTEGWIFSAFLLRKEVYEAVGEFDEHFWGSGLEDWDYLERLKERGITPVLCRDFKILHERRATKEIFESYSEWVEKHKEAVQYYRRKWGNGKHKLP